MRLICKFAIYRLIKTDSVPPSEPPSDAKSEPVGDPPFPLGQHSAPFRWCNIFLQQHCTTELRT